MVNQQSKASSTNTERSWSINSTKPHKVSTPSLLSHRQGKVYQSAILYAILHATFNNIKQRCKPNALYMLDALPHPSSRTNASSEEQYESRTKQGQFDADDESVRAETAP